tara:strand:+ start:525 stop:965 length:441 start_codon:yes stop_codon:yes gene_type:complete
MKDLGKLKQLFRDSILKSGLDHYTEAQLKAWSDRANVSSRWLGLIKEQYTILLEAENEVMGFASLRGEDYFDFLYVSQDQQGKGYAKQLYIAILAEAKKRGATKIYSDVSYMAKPFFLAQGFSILKENENKLGAEMLINFRVEKEL